MVKTFKWRVERAVQPSLEFRVITAQFGDGYKQVSSDGINNLDESWSITTPASLREARDIKAFFLEHKGVKSFLWTHRSVSLDYTPALILHMYNNQLNSMWSLVHLYDHMRAYNRGVNG